MIKFSKSPVFIILAIAVIGLFALGYDEYINYWWVLFSAYNAYEYYVNSKDSETGVSKYVYFWIGMTILWIFLSINTFT